MPFATIGDTRIFYRFEGIAGRPVIVLSHSIGCDLSLWAQQVPDLLQHFQVLRYDTRGHGASDVPAGDYSIEQLGSDALGLTDALGISKFAFCGVSLGGMTGQWLGANAGERLTGLILANTSAHVGPKTFWDERRRAVLEGGMVVIADGAMQRFFSRETLAEGNVYASSIRAVILGTDPIGYAGCCAAIRDMDHTALLAKIRVPALVIVGERDVSTPWMGHGEILARAIPGARAVHLPAAHLSNVERPRSFTAAIYDLLRPSAAPGNFADPIDEGFAVRRLVLGDGHVNRSIAATTDFNREFQELIARYAWGSIWTRPGLDKRTRRLLVLAITASLGRWEEFRMHVRAALDHGFEPCDLKELLLQSGIYAGVPAANTGFHIAMEEIEKKASSASA
ncbi:MAG TPA: 3-oxoadipate enol-lactonase [Candidatus Acidoferrales bacterium]|jgi:3-oxoadipate enol-lactonase/4-carboxymuconolactone decarboxylase|nr:3-oxoadipate enol-lactonase [Candidatus Acidoferrales bacterium]